jgi:hypothetical protein
MQSETKSCQNCKKDFTIEPEDFLFYEKIKVPAPTWCPDCRLQRRLAYRESRSLYKNICRKCGIEVVSIFSDKSFVKVYCSKCWWGDGWDALDYGKDYDFSKSFFQQFYELQKSVPREAAGQKNSDNCKYSNGDVRCKNCMLTYDCVESINCYNSQVSIFSKDSVDTDNSVGMDQVFNSIGSNNVYNSKFIYYSDECMDSAFLFNCINCIKCIGCVNLRNKKYCILNKQYSKEEYEEKLLEYNLGDFKNNEDFKKLFLDLYYQTPRRFAFIKNAENVYGDDIKNTKNCFNCFFTRNGVENCKNVFAAGFLLKDSVDATFGGDRSEIFYETSGGMESSNCFFTRAANSSRELRYCDRVINCSYCFGCVHIKNRSYCILNKQYLKEEYFDMVEKIKKHMEDVPYIDRKNRIYKYGEFFPAELSLWSYNKTWANRYFPLYREQALEFGYNWEEDQDRNESKYLDVKDLPLDIKDASDNILEKVIKCSHFDEVCSHECTRFFKILPNELNFYRKLKIPIPRICPHCRHYERIKWSNPLKLWHRKCMKEGCSNEFETAIGPDRKEIVYCKECYQAEFI